MTRGLTHAQVAQLLRPVNPNRVLLDGKGNKHLAAHDVRAHLDRIFGFANWDFELIDVECIDIRQHVKRDGTEPKGRVDVVYRATGRLTIRDPEGNYLARYEDGSTGAATNQSLADGHDLAMKSAISLALKRCAVNLGDGFGASLYNKGSMNALVRGTLVMPEAPKEGTETEDVQEGVEKQESLGVDESTQHHNPAENATEADVEDTLEYIAQETDVAKLRQAWSNAGSLTPEARAKVQKAVTDRVDVLAKAGKSEAGA